MNKYLIVPFLLVVPAFLHAAAPSSVTLKSSATTVEYGHPETFTASVSPASATGKVTFYRGTIVLETEPVVKGVAVFTTSQLPSGAHWFTAYYSGDSAYRSSTSVGVSIQVKTVPSNGFGAPLSTLLSVPAHATFAVGDFNGDGKPDLAVDDPDGMSILLANGDGTFGEPVTFSSASGPAMAVADFNGDGNADIAVSTGGGAISVILGNGDGTFQAPLISTSGVTDAYGIAVGDFNRDGKADLAVANPNFGGVNIVLGNGDGTFQSPAVYAPDLSYPTIVVIGDFNGDGNADLAVASHSGASVLLGNGNGTFQSELAVVTGVTADSLALGDFNGDGITDLATSTSGRTEIQVGNGDGTFHFAGTSSLLSRTAGYSTIAVCDFN